MQDSVGDGLPRWPARRRSFVLHNSQKHLGELHHLQEVEAHRVKEKEREEFRLPKIGREIPKHASRKNLKRQNLPPFFSSEGLTKELSDVSRHLKIKRGFLHPKRKIVSTQPARKTLRFRFEYKWTQQRDREERQRRTPIPQQMSQLLDSLALSPYAKQSNKEDFERWHISIDRLKAHYDETCRADDLRFAESPHHTEALTDGLKAGRENSEGEEGSKNEERRQKELEALTRQVNAAVERMVAYMHEGGMKAPQVGSETYALLTEVVFGLVNFTKRLERLDDQEESEDRDEILDEDSDLNQSEKNLEKEKEKERADEDEGKGKALRRSSCRSLRSDGEIASAPISRSPSVVPLGLNSDMSSIASKTSSNASSPGSSSSPSSSSSKSSSRSSRVSSQNSKEGEALDLTSEKLGGEGEREKGPKRKKEKKRRKKDTSRRKRKGRQGTLLSGVSGFLERALSRDLTNSLGEHASIMALLSEQRRTSSSGSQTGRQKEREQEIEKINEEAAALEDLLNRMSDALGIPEFQLLSLVAESLQEGKDGLDPTRPLDFDAMEEVMSDSESSESSDDDANASGRDETVLPVEMPVSASRHFLGWVRLEPRDEADLRAILEESAVGGARAFRRSFVSAVAEEAAGPSRNSLDGHCSDWMGDEEDFTVPPPLDVYGSGPLLFSAGTELPSPSQFGRVTQRSSTAMSGGGTPGGGGGNVFSWTMSAGSNGSQGSGVPLSAAPLNDAQLAWIESEPLLGLQAAFDSSLQLDWSRRGTQGNFTEATRAGGALRKGGEDSIIISRQPELPFYGPSLPSSSRPFRNDEGGRGGERERERERETRGKENGPRQSPYCDAVVPVRFIQEPTVLQVFLQELRSGSSSLYRKTEGGELMRVRAVCLVRVVRNTGGGFAKRGSTSLRGSVSAGATRPSSGQIKLSSSALESELFNSGGMGSSPREIFQPQGLNKISVLCPCERDVERLSPLGCEAFIPLSELPLIRPMCPSESPMEAAAEILKQRLGALSTSVTLVPSSYKRLERRAKAAESEEFLAQMLTRRSTRKASERSLVLTADGSVDSSDEGQMGTTTKNPFASVVATQEVSEAEASHLGFTSAEIFRGLTVVDEIHIITATGSALPATSFPTQALPLIRLERPPDTQVGGLSSFQQEPVEGEGGPALREGDRNESREDGWKGISGSLPPFLLPWRRAFESVERRHRVSPDDLNKLCSLPGAKWGSEHFPADVPLTSFGHEDSSVLSRLLVAQKERETVNQWHWLPMNDWVKTLQRKNRLRLRHWSHSALDSDPPLAGSSRNWDGRRRDSDAEDPGLFQRSKAFVKRWKGSLVLWAGTPSLQKNVDAILASLCAGATQVRYEVLSQTEESQSHQAVLMARPFDNRGKHMEPCLVMLMPRTAVRMAVEANELLVAALGEPAALAVTGTSANGLIGAVRLTMRTAGWLEHGNLHGFEERRLVPFSDFVVFAMGACERKAQPEAEEGGAGFGRGAGGASKMPSLSQSMARNAGAGEGGKDGRRQSKISFGGARGLLTSLARRIFGFQLRHLLKDQRLVKAAVGTSGPKDSVFELFDMKHLINDALFAPKHSLDTFKPNEQSDGAPSTHHTEGKQQQQQEVPLAVSGCDDVRSFFFRFWEEVCLVAQLRDESTGGAAGMQRDRRGGGRQTTTATPQLKGRRRTGVTRSGGAARASVSNAHLGIVRGDFRPESVLVDPVGDAFEQYPEESSVLGLPLLVGRGRIPRPLKTDTLSAEGSSYRPWILWHRLRRHHVVSDLAAFEVNVIALAMQGTPCTLRQINECKSPTELSEVLGGRRKILASVIWEGIESFYSSNASMGQEDLLRTFGTSTDLQGLLSSPDDSKVKEGRKSRLVARLRATLLGSNPSSGPVKSETTGDLMGAGMSQAASRKSTRPFTSTGREGESMGGILSMASPMPQSGASQFNRRASLTGTSLPFPTKDALLQTVRSRLGFRYEALTRMLVVSEPQDAIAIQGDIVTILNAVATCPDVRVLPPSLNLTTARGRECWAVICEIRRWVWVFLRPDPPTNIAKLEEQKQQQQQQQQQPTEEAEQDAETGDGEKEQKKRGNWWEPLHYSAALLASCMKFLRTQQRSRTRRMAEKESQQEGPGGGKETVESLGDAMGKRWEADSQGSRSQLLMVIQMAMLHAEAILSSLIGEPGRFSSALISLSGDSNQPSISPSTAQNRRSSLSAGGGMPMMNVYSSARKINSPWDMPPDNPRKALTFFQKGTVFIDERIDPTPVGVPPSKSAELGVCDVSRKEEATDLTVGGIEFDWETNAESLIHTQLALHSHYP
eukprot:Cvel_13966.t1-p1 / transcript=Cvel_13966.t1 / gene=Cvel_13966 / organism=Chromera_velia_CCMP2878 / gene_product=hypothetical protein / transcript_product=hypothetical protein / location=Cvel_scaffold976:164-10580(-) / protein_length=2303 / sequence_SO=supercontig / SO=protein_coding / is_pseudo=false